MQDGQQTIYRRNELKVVTDDVEISLFFSNHMIFLRGNSGTGKTYLMSYLSSLQDNKDMILSSSYPIEDMVFIMSDKELENLETYKNKLIFVDRFDIYTKSAKERIINKLKRSDCTWVIASRNLNIPYIQGFSTDSLKILNSKKANGKTHIYLESQL